LGEVEVELTAFQTCPKKVKAKEKGKKENNQT